MLYEAAQILLVRSTQWSWLKAWAMHRQAPRREKRRSWHWRAGWPWSCIASGLMAPSSGGPEKKLQQHEGSAGLHLIGENWSSTSWWNDVPRRTMNEVRSYVRLDRSQEYLLDRRRPCHQIRPEQDPLSADGHIGKAAIASARSDPRCDPGRRDLPHHQLLQLVLPALRRGRPSQLRRLWPAQDHRYDVCGERRDRTSAHGDLRLGYASDGDDVHARGKSRSARRGWSRSVGL